MKIKSIYIDGLHNAVNKTYTFGDTVYIFGNNGAGKSTILQAIQFALLGYIPGTAKNSREAFLRHSPINKIEVKLSLLDDTGTDILITRLVTQKENLLSVIPENYDISSIIEDIELPIFNFSEFVGQTANKLKEYFIKNILPNANGKLDWKQILTESIIDCNFQDREEIIEYGMSLIKDVDGEILEQVISANQFFKAEQSFNKTELQRLQNTIDSLIYYDDYTGPTNIDELNSELLSANAIRDQLIRYQSDIERVQSQRAEIQSLEARIESLGGKDEYEVASKELETLRVQDNNYTNAINELTSKQAAIKAHDHSYDTIISSNGICPYTKESCKSISDKIDAIRNDSVKLKAEALEVQQKITELQVAQTNIRVKIRKLEGIMTDLTNIWGRIETVKKVIGQLPEKPNTTMTIQELDAKIDSLTVSKTKLLANKQYNETIDNITKLKFKAELQGKALACWVKKTDTNGLQTTLMLQPFEELAKTMTEYIQKMYNRDDIRAHFNITTKANSFSFGLIRNSVYIPYDLLSSGEKCLYTLSLMMCIVKNSKSPLKLLLCDDMFDHLDSTAIESTFATLKNINDIQFIFAGVKECNNAKDIVLQV